MSDPIPPPLPITNPTTGSTEVFVAQPKGASEPVVVATTISALLVQVLGLAAAFGLDVSGPQRAAILSSIEPVVVGLFLLGPIIRSYVVPVWKTKALVDAAHAAGQVGADKPQV